MNKLFQAISDPTRREVLKLLKKGELKVGEIHQHFEMSGASLSHHLNVLKQAELVLSEKRGQYVVYSLNTTVVQDILEWVYELIDRKV